MELPESVLLCLFPNGVVLSPQRQARQEGDDAEEGEDVYYVEVSWAFVDIGGRGAVLLFRLPRTPRS